MLVKYFEEEWFRLNHKFYLSLIFSILLFNVDLILLTSSMVINQADSGFAMSKYISANWWDKLFCS